MKYNKKDYADFILNKIIKHSEVPIVSLEAEIRHPLQSLADLLTMKELGKVKKPKVVLSWAPHPRALPQAVSNSFAEWVLNAGMDLTITHPKGYELSKKFTKGATIEYNQTTAFKDADFAEAGAVITEDLLSAQVIFGLKEVGIPYLIPQ